MTLALALAILLLAPAQARDLDKRLGRTQVRVQSGTYALEVGRTIQELALPERLERLGYRRVSGRPEQPGQYFWGDEVFWIYRNEHRARGRRRPARLLGLVLDDRGRVVGGRKATDRPMALDGRRGRWLEPEILAESFSGERAPRELVELDELPERVWRPLLALEDARFYQHIGVDGKAIARAALANAKAGRTVQGGSTITQQLIKNRDLTARRSLDRKASEAVRALWVEARYTKQAILQAYLNAVYYGHVEGVAVHGIGSAARVFFSKPARELSLDEAALLAAMVQGPNALSPIRHPEAATERRDRALERMVELGWASEQEAVEARSRPISLSLSPPSRPGARHFRMWVEQEAREDSPRRMDKGLGLSVETTLDPLLQIRAEDAVEQHLATLRRRYPKLRDAGLQAALVAVDARTGEVLAHVGGDPAQRDDHFDRVTRASRQPGSTVKPLILLEAFETCGANKPLNPATLVADEPLEIELPSGPWRPSNYDGRHHGVVDLRSALRHSYNTPFVRVSEYCGRRAVAGRLEATGLELPDEPPPSFALGAVETTPLDVVGAYTVFATLGRISVPFGVRRIERPCGCRTGGDRVRRRQVSSASAAYLVRDLLDDAVESGTGRPADLGGVEVIGKTGTSSGTRDAWFVGHGGGLVTGVWVGLDRGGRLGLTGSAAAAPLWKDFMEGAVPTRPPFLVRRPGDVLVRTVNPENGLILVVGKNKGREEVFRRGALPRRDRFWKKDEPDLVIR